MRIKSIGIQIGIVCFILVVGIMMRTIINDSKAAKTYLDQIHTYTPDYPKTKNGQTYGSPTDATSIETLPDLILVGTVDGTAGYVLKKDFIGEQPKIPEEAITIQKSSSQGGRNVQLYDVDGKTIIGSFRIGAMNQIPTKATNYPKNENGQTYGFAADATSYESIPDLISAVGVDGTAGYVRKKDLDGEQPKTPEEALAIQKNRPVGGRDIPLYDVDGKTIIGVFHIG
ncbi:MULTISPECIES: hypothetical protein [unclassified Paenibacillus]|uniref:hypothetical protein n=1 Tax=unclassified Paenibacillus TaxID=185978 RepID=UPI00363CDA26